MSLHDGPIHARSVAKIICVDDQTPHAASLAGQSVREVWRERSGSHVDRVTAFKGDRVGGRHVQKRLQGPRDRSLPSKSARTRARGCSRAENEQSRHAVVDAHNLSRSRACAICRRIRNARNENKAAKFDRFFTALVYSLRCGSRGCPSIEFRPARLSGRARVRGAVSSDG